MTKRTIEERREEWLKTGNKGVSSQTIHDFMTHGQAYEPGYPHDGADFGRCVQLLTMIPEWENRLTEMAKIPGLDGKVWAALAVAWPDLKASFARDPGQPFYDRIQAIILPLEKESGEVAHLGKGVSMRVRSRTVPKGATKAQTERIAQAQEDADRAVEGFKNALEGKDVDNTSDAGGIAGKRLKAFIERIERLEAEKTALSEDIKDVYAEAKGVGFDAKTMRKILRLRKMDAEKRREEDELLELYKSAIGMD